MRQTLEGKGAKKKAAIVRAQLKTAVEFMHIGDDDDDDHGKDQMWSFDVPLEPEDDEDEGEDQDKKVPIGIRRQEVVDDGWKAFAAMGKLITLSDGLHSNYKKVLALDQIQKGWYKFGAKAVSEMRIATHQARQVQRAKIKQRTQ